MINIHEPTMCSIASSYTSSADFLTTISHVSSIFTTTLNLYGVALIWFQTPERMKSLRLVVLNSHVCGLITDLMIGTMTIPFIFFPHVAGIPLGILGVLGVNVYFQTYLTISLIGAHAASIVILLENRQNKIVTGRWKIKKPITRQIFYFFNFFAVFVTSVPIYFDIPDQEKSKIELIQLLPCQKSIILNSALIVLSEKKSLICFLLVFILIFYLSQGAFFVFHSLINLYQSSRLSSLSIKTRSLQKKYFLSVCFQISIPLAVLCLPICYFTYSIIENHFNLTLNNIAVLFMSTHGSNSTIVTILIYEHYRKFTFRCHQKVASQHEKSIAVVTKFQDSHSYI